MTQRPATLLESAVNQWLTSPQTTTSKNNATLQLTEEDSVERDDALKLALDCGVIPLSALLGALGNVLCVVVFLRQRYRSVSKPLLLGLCASDFLLLLSAFLTSIPCLVKHVDSLERGAELQAVMTPQVAVFRDIMSRMTVLLTLAIGVERSVAVTRPLKLRAVCTVPRTRTVVILVFVAVFALQAPAFFRYDVGRDVTLPSNVTRLTVQMTAFYRQNQRVVDFYFDYLLLVLLRGLPLVSMFVCFCIILVSLMRRLQSACPKVPKVGAFARAAKAGQGRRESPSSSAAESSEHGDLLLEEKKLTRALLVVILLCLLSEIPAFVMEVLLVMHETTQPASPFLVCRLLYVLNSALNFPLFMITYKHFSVTFKTVIGMLVRT